LGLLEKARTGLGLVQTGPNLPVDKLPEAELETFIQTAKDWGIELNGTRGLDYDHVSRPWLGVWAETDPYAAGNRREICRR
jgi:hypothetical protein